MRAMMSAAGAGSAVIITSATAGGAVCATTLAGLATDGLGDGISSDPLESPQNPLTPSANALSDDEDDVAMSDSFDEDGGSSPPYFSQNLDEVTAQLAAAGGWTGPVGVAAAAAIASAKKRKKHHCFELNPSIRKRQQTRLLRKLKMIIDEYTTRVGQQAVILVATPSKSGNNFKCFGAKPLEDVIKTLRQVIMAELESALALQAPPPQQEDPSLYELPPLVIDGIPTPVEKMTQAQLRAFIPLMLKYSTGRGKPGWGRETTRPVWWPKEVPWANVRMDARSDDQKHKISWTTALRQVVINCYKYHGRDDLLPAFVEEDDKSHQLCDGTLLNVSSASGNNGTTALTATATLAGVATAGDATGLLPGTMVHTISNHDGTVSIIQVDPNNPVIQLPDGTTAQVQGIAHVTGDGSDGEVQTVALDLNQHNTEASLGQDGSIIITGVDTSHIPGSVSGTYCASSIPGMISLPLPLYHTVVANLQSSDGQPMHVVTPVVQVPKLEPGLDGGGGLTSVEVAALNTTLDAGTIIATAARAQQVSSGDAQNGTEDDDHHQTVELVTQKTGD